MNCQDIALVLDDAGFDALDARARQSAVARLESFTDCRNEWELPARLIARSIPPMPASLVADCRALVASGPQADRGQRARSRFILIGAVALVAAAAALLVAALWPAAGVPEQDTLSEAANALPMGGSTVTRAGAATDLQSGGDAPEAPVPAFLVFVPPLVDPDAVPVGKGDPMAWLAEQVRAVERNPARRNAMASFRAALIGELLLVPGLGLVDAEAELGKATPSMPGYSIKVSGSYQLSASGQFVDPGSRYVAVSVGAARQLPDGKLTSPPQLFSANIDLQGECRSAANGAVTCADAHSQAVTVVRQMRERLFPPDPSITRERQARLLNGSLEPAQRFSALEELLGTQRGGAPQVAALRDPVTLRGLLDLAAAGDPALRARIWRTLRGVAEPDLLQPLQASALGDADEPRLEAVATLAADFAQDPRARVTLESVAGTDTRALVRALAQRGLSGEAAWRAYVNSSLLDTDLTASERVEGFAYQYNLPSRFQPQGTGQHYAAFSLLDEAAADVLLQLVVQASDEQPASEGRMVRLANAMAARDVKNVAATEALLHYLRHGKSTNTRMIAVQTLGGRNRNDQQVREALREALRSDPSPEVRDWIKQVMGEEFAAAAQ